MDTTDEKQVAEFESLLEELRKQLLDACIHFDIWEQLWPTEEAVGVINQYKGFFLPTRNAHLDRFFIKVCNVLSNDPKSPSFYRVLSMLGKNPSLASGISVRELKNRLKKYKEVLTGIEQYRNTRAAHWDTEILEQRKLVLFGQCKRMLKELQDIFNEISGAHSHNVWSFRTMQQGDTSGLLNALKLWRQQKPLVNPAREVEMGKREELSREHARLAVRKQELETQQKEMLPKVGETWVLSLEDLDKHEKIEGEIKEIDTRLREIEEQLRKLPKPEKES